jgi:hypothetical protein
MTTRKDKAQDKSVLEDKQRFEESGDKEKIAHMGDKPTQQPSREKDEKKK